MLTNLQPPLSNVQTELLKLYSTDISDEMLLELKKVMAKFFLDKLRNQADQVWEEKKYTDEFFKNLNPNA
ncbi:hypothetical protein EXU85_30710 [Spirosoma sp. KCTC 42546]|uniref:hypothetical protein n=1 Tax=Spirosoma sp. KCTC 42546 TaxID=2520506 RepID=UPI00115A29D2|nr:hypothetical protein [Spirosoma sp. KCTC 42546]QDK82746.1 hypothetical protein EXU85_30710 [Spirosoma sp. KCTC 42546]